MPGPPRDGHRRVAPGWCGQGDDVAPGIERTIIRRVRLRAELCRAEILTIGGRSTRLTERLERCSDSLTSFIQSDLRDLAHRRSGSRLTHGAKARIDEETDVPKLTSAAQYVDASRNDADSIASLHADSWRRHYRGAYLDAYLDGDVDTDRQEVWRSRLAEPTRGQMTVIARCDGEVLGFAHTIEDEDPLWGSLLENLHVRSDLKRNGVGSRLLSETAERLVRLRPAGSLHLWVLDQNTAAQAFYTARGGSRVETELRGPFPGGGRALGHRYHWTDPSRLLVGPQVKGDDGLG